MVERFAAANARGSGATMSRRARRWVFIFRSSDDAMWKVQPARVNAALGDGPGRAAGGRPPEPFDVSAEPERRGIGSATAPGAVFPALAENSLRSGFSRNSPAPVPKAGREGASSHARGRACSPWVGVRAQTGSEWGGRDAAGRQTWQRGRNPTGQGARPGSRRWQRWERPSLCP